MTRSPFEYALLQPFDPFYRLAATATGITAPELWARRSIFTLDNPNTGLQKKLLLAENIFAGSNECRPVDLCNALHFMPSSCASTSLLAFCCCSGQPYGGCGSLQMGSAPRILLIFMTGVILMRAAGCVINDIADHRLDRHVARTRLRPLAAKQISLTEAWIIFLMLLTLALILVLQLNLLTRQLACLAALSACLYPFLKRVTHLPQLGLGIAFSFSIPMAFAPSRIRSQRLRSGFSWQICSGLSCMIRNMP